MERHAVMLAVLSADFTMRHSHGQDGFPQRSMEGQAER